MCRENDQNLSSCKQRTEFGTFRYGTLSNVPPMSYQSRTCVSNLALEGPEASKCSLERR